MGKKKGNTNETDVAETGAVALEQAVSQEHDEPAAAALVDGDGGTAVDPPAGEHAAEPAPAADQPEAGEHDAEPQDEAPADAADVVETPPGEKSEGVSDEHGTITGHAGDAGSDGVAGDEGAASVDELGGERDPAGGSDLGNGVAVLGEGDDGSGAGQAGHDDVRHGDAADDADHGGGDHDGRHDGDAGDGAADGAGPLDAGDGSTGVVLGGEGTDLRSGSADPAPAAGANEPNHVDDPTLEPADGILATAENACFAVLQYLDEFFIVEDDERARLALLGGEVGSKATNAIAACVRDIGKERATPAVVGQQLKILRLIEDPELSEKEALVVSTFISVLTAIDAHDRIVLERWRAEQAEKPEPRPLPMDESTMETADDPLATWGG